MGQARGQHVLARLELLRGDITKCRVDAVMNAANSRLLGGGGVDGAIHRAAGPELLARCRELGGCPTGEAKLTQGYKLPARFVSHTVSSVWQGGAADEDELLASCYQSAFRSAAEPPLRSLAFSPISTGVYGFPGARAAPIALRKIRAGPEGNSQLERVTVVYFSDPDLSNYKDALETLEAR